MVHQRTGRSHSLVEKGRFPRRAHLLILVCGVVARVALLESVLFTLHVAREGAGVDVETRAWNFFALVPMMLLHRSRGAGSTGRTEVSKSSRLKKCQDQVQRRVTSEAEEQHRRGKAAQNRVERGQVSRARQELIGA